MRSVSTTNQELRLSYQNATEESRVQLIDLRSELRMQEDRLRTDRGKANAYVSEIEQRLQELNNAMVDGGTSVFVKLEHMSSLEQQAETSGARLKTAKEESDKLRLANDNLVMQLDRANAARLSEIGKDSLVKSELRQKVAELELSLQSRGGSTGVEEIAEQKKN